MKYWIRVILEYGWGCGTCGRPINMGQPAFILMDTEQIPGRVEWLNCVECMKVKFPDLASEF